MNQLLNIPANSNLDLFVDIPQYTTKAQSTKERLLLQYPDKGIELISFHTLKASTLANSMLEMLFLDLSRNAKKQIAEDLLGRPDDYGKLDALIWVFNLNQNGASVPFDWCCENSNIEGESLDPEAIRRIIARSTRPELKRCLQIVSMTFGYSFAKECEARLMAYVNLAGWNVQ